MTEPGLPGEAVDDGAARDVGAVAVTAGASELAAEADGAADPGAGLPVGAGEPQALAASATQRDEGGDPERARGSRGPLHLVMLARLGGTAFARLPGRRWPMAELEWTTEPVGAGAR